MDANGDKFVIDASFALSFLMPDESQKSSTSYFAGFVSGKIQPLSSSLLPFEIGNSLKSAFFQKRISSDRALTLILEFQSVNIPLIEPDPKKTVESSIKHKLSFSTLAISSLLCHKIASYCHWTNTSKTSPLNFH